MSRHVQAGGGVLWRRTSGEIRVAVVHRPRYDDWSLPKGKLDKGEHHVLAAVREVCEETGFSAVVGRTLGESHYRVLDSGRDVPKTVRWWAMRATGGQFSPGPEVDELVWLDVAAARRRVNLGWDDGPLAIFAQHPPETTTVLLVRHGSAGRKQDWEGPDLERPLDDRGRAQARAVATVLPAYGPGRVLSAPAWRCRQTVEPLAEALALPVEVEANLSEQSAEALPECLRTLAASRVPAVACSQGGAIPHGLSALAADAGLALPSTSAKKGSVWALSFSAGRLIDADYAAELLS